MLESILATYGVIPSDVYIVAVSLFVIKTGTGMLLSALTALQRELYSFSKNFKSAADDVKRFSQTSERQYRPENFRR
jgi:hypothetical protein